MDLLKREVQKHRNVIFSTMFLMIGGAAVLILNELGVFVPQGKMAGLTVAISFSIIIASGFVLSAVSEFSWRMQCIKKGHDLTVDLVMQNNSAIVIKALLKMLKRDDVDDYTKSLVNAQINHLVDKSMKKIDINLVEKWMKDLKKHISIQVENELYLDTTHKPKVMFLVKQLLKAEDVNENQKEQLSLFLEAMHKDAKHVVTIMQPSGKKLVAYDNHIGSVINEIKQARIESATACIPKVTADFFKKS